MWSSVSLWNSWKPQAQREFVSTSKIFSRASTKYSSLEQRERVPSVVRACKWWLAGTGGQAWLTAHFSRPFSHRKGHETSLSPGLKQRSMASVQGVEVKASSRQETLIGPGSYRNTKQSSAPSRKRQENLSFSQSTTGTRKSFAALGKRSKNTEKDPTQSLGVQTGPGKSRIPLFPLQG